MSVSYQSSHAQVSFVLCLAEQILMAPPNASRSVGTAQRRMTPEHRAELAALEAAAHELLDAAELLGKVRGERLALTIALLVSRYRKHIKL